MELIFEWDKNKAQTNLIKHKVSFEEAASIFADENSITIDDPAHSLSEKRSITLGLSFAKRILVAVHTERNGNIRIISARLASRKERVQYGV
jgi:uncharacterized protein